MQDPISTKKKVRGKRLTQEKIIEQFREKHGDYYDYSLVEFNTVWDDVIIICPRHGQFKQPAKRHKNGGRCRKCYLEDTNGKFMKKPEYREKARETMKNNQDKLKAGMIAKYGEDNASKIESVRIAKRELFLSKYGVTSGFDINREDQAIKAKNTKIENGTWLKYEDLKPYQRYVKEVWKHTNKSIVDFDAYWLLENRCMHGNHIDHIYSTKDGFINNVSPKLIGSIVNIQSLPAHINKSKGSNSWITLEYLELSYSTIYDGI
jgi:hypothetical protein